MTIRLHRGDLPDLSNYKGSVAIDTETMGLDPRRDRLCVVQMSNGDGSADVVQIPRGHTDAPNLKKLLGDPSVLKIFHFARFDVGVLSHALGVMPQPIYCTKIASRLTRTYTDRHGLKDLVREVLNIDLSKQQQSSDWGSRDAERGSGRLCRLRRAASSRAEGEARRHAGRAKAAPSSPRPASRSCRTGRGSTCRAGPSRTFSRIPERVDSRKWHARLRVCPVPVTLLGSVAGRCRGSVRAMGLRPLSEPHEWNRYHRIGDRLRRPACTHRMPIRRWPRRAVSAPPRAIRRRVRTLRVVIPVAGRARARGNRVRLGFQSVAHAGQPADRDGKPRCVGHQDHHGGAAHGGLHARRTGL